MTGEIPLADCSAQQWIDCFDRFKKSPVMAGQIFADAKQALDDLKVNGMGSNSLKRDKVLTDKQLKEVWQHNLG